MPSTEQTPEFGLADFLTTLFRRKLTILITVVVAVAAVVGIESRHTPIYQATAGLLVSPPYSINSLGGVVPSNANAVSLPNVVAVINSGLERAQVAKQIGSAPPATVQAIGGTDELNITVQSPSPKFAAVAANAYATAFLTVNRQQVANEVKPAQKRQQQQINNDTATLGLLNTQLQQYLATAGTPQQNIDNLEAQIASTESQITEARQQYYQTTLLSSLNEAGGQILNQAKANHTVVSPKLPQDAALALLGGIVLGLGFAFLREYLDDRIRTKTDLERVMGLIPSLGVIPEVQDWTDRKSSYLVSVERPRSPTSEAYRGLRTAIQFMGLGDPIRTLQLTSPAANDGKTATTANLAVAMALAGQRVVAVSCDLRRPRLHQFFDLPNTVGVTSVLLGDVPLEEALLSVPGVGGLLILPSGPVPPNPSELLSSPKMAEVFEQLAADADIILIDSPPVLPVTDATVLAGRVDAVVLVAAAGYSTKHNIARALELLDRVEAPLVGAVLNGASSIDSYGYDAGYTYRQAADADKSGNHRPGAPAAAVAAATTASAANPPGGPK